MPGFTICAADQRHAKRKRRRRWPGWHALRLAPGGGGGQYAGENLAGGGVK